MPVPAVIVPIKPTPFLDPVSPRVVTSMPDASTAQPAPARRQRTSRSHATQPRSARTTDVSSTHAAGSASPRPRNAESEDKKPAKPASKRSRNTDGAPTNDPFERLDNMRLQ
jgi:hypothetical protein